MVSATLTRGPTAHHEADLATYAPGTRTVMIERAHVGEDVPIVVTYTDTNDAATDPDSAPTITITDPSDTAQVDAVTMTSDTTGEYEHVWDSATNASDTGTYTVTVTAELSSETKITEETIELFD